MEYKINRVVVIGAGVMGAGIAAHLANYGLEVLLVDRVPSELTDAEREKGWTESTPEWRNQISLNGIDLLLKARRPVFSSEESLKRVAVGNTEDDIDKFGEYDWIIETIIENLEIKRALFEKIEKVRKPGSIVSTNTSGLPISLVSAEFSDDLKEHFLGTHFFNPPYIMTLLELIPGPKTRPEVMDFMYSFSRDKLGKNPLIVKDTPNFICNRMAIITALNGFRLCQQLGITVEQADAIGGKPMGRQSSAFFGLSDAVGLDTVANITRNIKTNAPNDERSDLFVLTSFMEKMLEKNWLGDKTRGGFYKKTKDASGEVKLMVLDLATVEYRDPIQVDFPCLKAAAAAEAPADKVRALLAGDDPGSLFAWEVLSNDLVYAANRVPEISNSILDIDKAMKLGYYWRLGPFECWDAIGLRKSVERMHKEGKSVPAKIDKMLEQGCESFYKTENGLAYYYDFETSSYLPIQ